MFHIFEILRNTNAAFGVSKAFVPYCKTNYELTTYTDGLALTSGSVNSGSLNDITKNSFNVYTSNVSDRPISGSGWFYVKTTVYGSDTTHIIQEATALSDGTTYIRVKFEGTWKEWKQVTNS